MSVTMDIVSRASSIFANIAYRQASASGKRLVTRKVQIRFIASPHNKAVTEKKQHVVVVASSKLTTFKIWSHYIVRWTPVVDNLQRRGSVGADNELGNEFVRERIKVFGIVLGAHRAAS
jgi:hypothetical protein